jgi:uncharacterized protein
MTQAKLFAPYETLANHLLPHAFDKTDDGSHDVAHIARVWANARAIHAIEGGDGRVLAAATLLHDCISLEKNAPDRSQGSRLAADKAEGVLATLNWDTVDIAAVSHAIVAHSFSANVTPTTLEARILQDADRLDAIGLIGVARCFYVAGRMGSGLYDPDDPHATQRPLDDRAFAIDHFETKLLKLASGFQTATGATMANARHASLQSFRDAFLEEVGAGPR